ncbi:MAG: hypothetical protein KDB88_08690 [Flavobacteriales bacterium]|nr:hypothetical protein [Flavobacteriales bacterium]
MEHDRPFILTSLLAVLLIAAPVRYTLAASPGDRPGDGVQLRGWLHVEDLSMRQAVLKVYVNGTVTEVRMSESGRFDLELPVNAKARLRFENPGHLPKEIDVDTRHARDGLFGRKPRQVRFGVILELERHMGRLNYAGPVGAIRFDAEGGCLAVDHDKQLVPQKKNKPMVF